MNMSGPAKRKPLKTQTSRNALNRQTSTVSNRSKERECIGVDGKDGRGEQMTPQQIKTALKIHQLAGEKEADFESIAATLGLDIEAQAYALVSEPSPKNTRQTVRKVNAPSPKGSMSFTSNAPPSFAQHMHMVNNSKLPGNGGGDFIISPG